MKLRIYGFQIGRSSSMRPKNPRLYGDFAEKAKLVWDMNYVPWEARKVMIVSIIREQRRRLNTPITILNASQVWKCGERETKMYRTSVIRWSLKNCSHAYGNPKRLPI